MKVYLAALTAAACLFPAPVLAASATAPDPAAVTYDQPAMQARMRMKLVNMQKVQEGLLLEDWTLLQDGVTQLMELDRTATWAMVRTPGYHEAGARFYQAAEDLMAAARQHDAKAAALPYLRLNMACLECHQQVRAHLGH